MHQGLAPVPGIARYRAHPKELTVVGAVVEMRKKRVSSFISEIWAFGCVVVPGRNPPKKCVRDGGIIFDDDA